MRNPVLSLCLACFALSAATSRAELPKLSVGTRDLTNTDQGVISREIHAPNQANKPKLSSDKAKVQDNLKVTDASLSADGQTMVVVGSEGEVLVGGFATKKVRARFRTGLGRNLTPLAVSHDGKQLALASRFERVVEIWTDTGKPVASFEIPAQAVSLCFSPADNYLVVGSDEHVSVFDLQSRSTWGTLKLDGSALGVVAVSPDETRIAVGYLFYIAVWNLADDRIDWRQPGGGQTPIRSLAFSPEGKRLVSTHLSPWADVWDVEQGGKIAGFGTEAGCDAAAFLGEEQVLLSRAACGPLVAYDMTGKEVKRHERMVNNVDSLGRTCLTPSGKQAVGLPSSVTSLRELHLWTSPDP